MSSKFNDAISEGFEKLFPDRKEQEEMGLDVDMRKYYFESGAQAAKQLYEHVVRELVEALEYIFSKKHFIGKPKWDAEFVEVAEIALKKYQDFKGEMNVKED